MIRIGVLTPHMAKGPELEVPAMAPGRIEAVVERVTDVADRSVGDVTNRRLDAAAERLAAASVDVIGYASTSYAYAAGFTAETEMVTRLSRRVGTPVAATCSSAVLALRSLGVKRIALVHPPWFENELNELGAGYFRSQGLEVVSSTSAALPDDPDRIETLAVCEWTSRHVGDDAEAVFIGGNGFRVVDAIGCLETAIERPVLSSNQVLFWNLLALAGAGLEITGYGRLFAIEPSTETRT